MKDTPKINADLWVDQYGDSLFHFALARVKNRDIAEDLVQETSLAAVKAQDQFKGQSSEKTWLSRRNFEMKHWMFRCNDVSQKVSQSLDAALPFHHRLAVRMHLMMCRYCARFRRQLIMLRMLSRQMDDEPSMDETTATLSNETKERIKKTLRAAP